MSGDTAIYLALALPALASVLAAVSGRWPNLRETLTLLFGVTLFIIVASLVPRVMDGARPAAELLTVMTGLPLAFEIEPLGMLFALVASGLWIVTTCYSIGYMRGHHEQNQSRYYACFAIAILGAIGTAMAANMFTLFVFYEVLTLSTYPLVTHHGTEKARRGGRTYLGILLTTSVAFLLLAVIWTYRVAGTLDFEVGGILAGKPGATSGTVVALLALYAFGTGKAALMPFHRWLPAAMVAPTPVSALLHAVAVVKAGVFTILKVVVYIFGIDLLKSTDASVWLMYVASATILIASLVALSKDNLKARLAYSTVSQLSYIVLGGALANHWSIIGGGMHIVMHAFGKITLFFCAGAIYVATNKTEISDMRGIGRTMPFTMFAFLIGALSVIGLPPMGGSWSKWYLALGAVDSPHAIFVWVLMISSLLNIAYLIPPVVRGFFFAPRGETNPRIKEAPLFCVVPLCFTAAGCVVLFFLADGVYDLLTPLARAP
ncbi:MAG: monovalent cation/H+ antiporter subunit D family protein [Planctomycetota bacterium]